jgi:hypothetical protein
MQYFTTQLNAHQQTTHTLRASQYRPLKKRRRGEEHAESSSPEPEDNTLSTSKPHLHASHDSPELAQLRVAGLLPEATSDIPPLPFPHAPARTPKERNRARKIQEEIAQPPSRLYAINALSKGDSINKQSEATSLKKTHLNVLSAVLHRCLLEGDYERAGRAWGMLLRTQVAGGNPVDPRNHGRWGIGAELLLRRDANMMEGDSNAPPSNQQSPSQAMFSEEGFALAREYFERLIVQHPNRKLMPHAIDERTFYPAMFSLWIFEVCEKSRRAREKNQENTRGLRSRSMSLDSVLGETYNADDLQAREDAIQVEELVAATEIAERLDQLVASPPFDKQASLLHLRGHVGLWVSILLLGQTSTDEDWDMDTTNTSDEDVSLSTAEQLTRIANCQRGLQQAQQFLLRAEANGASRQIATLASVDIKLRQLTRKSATLRAVGED